MQSKFYRGLALGVALVFVAAGLWGFFAVRGQQPGAPALFSPLFEAYQRIKSNFYRPENAPDARLLKGAIEGMVETLGDPYSRYLSADDYRQFNEGFEKEVVEEFGGLGMQIEVRDGKLLVVAPLPDTPASRAGIEAGDWIVEIDGQSTEGITQEQAVRKLRGPKGTLVTLKIRREDGTAKTFEIVREIITVKIVSHSVLANGQVGYIQVYTFNTLTRVDVEKALKDLVARGVKGLILDLRNNPGGLLTQAVDLASLFIDAGPVLKVQSRNGSEVYNSKGNRYPNLPLAVLINRGTASASEIVAGAIQDHQMGVLFGKRTFGKGVIQTSFTLSDGSAILLTTAEYFTPKGRRVHETGITPDVITERESETLQRAVHWVLSQAGKTCPCLPPPSNDRSARARPSPFLVWFTP
ncbi:MAG: S41 family peptidase [Candidatus Bipolaricaulia bacterium]